MKKVLSIEIKLPSTDETQDIIEKAGFYDMGYDKKWGNYRLRFIKQEIKSKKDTLLSLMESAYKNFK